MEYSIYMYSEPVLSNHSWGMLEVTQGVKFKINWEQKDIKIGSLDPDISSSAVFRWVQL